MTTTFRLEYSPKSKVDLVIISSSVMDTSERVESGGNSVILEGPLIDITIALSVEANDEEVEVILRRAVLMGVMI